MSDAKSGGLVEWLLKKRTGGDDNDTGSESGGDDDDDDGSGGIKLRWVLLTVGGVGLFAKWMYDKLGARKAGKAAVSPAPAPRVVAAPPDRPAPQVDQAAVAAAATPPLPEAQQLPVEAVQQGQPDAIAPQIGDNWVSTPGRQKTILQFVCPKMVTNFAIFAMSLDKMVLACNYLVLQKRLPDTLIMDCFFTFLDVVGTFISKEERKNTVLADVSCVIMRNALRNGVMGSGPYNTVCNYLTSWFMFRRKLFNKETTIAQNKEAIGLIQDAGMVAEAQFIMGMENETPELIEETYRLALDWKVDMANWNMYTPWPFAELFEDLGLAGR